MPQKPAVQVPLHEQVICWQHHFAFTHSGPPIASCLVLSMHAPVTLTEPLC